MTEITFTTDMLRPIIFGIRESSFVADFLIFRTLFGLKLPYSQMGKLVVRFSLFVLDITNPTQARGE